MDDENGNGFKELWQSLKRHPAILITAIVAVLIVLYILIKSGQGSGSAPVASTPIVNAPSNSTPQTVTPLSPTPNTIGGGNSGSTPIINTGSSTPVVAPTPMPPIPTPVVPKTGVGGTHVPSGGVVAYTDPSGQPTANQPYLGLLGPNVGVNFQNRTYMENGKAIALPSYVGNLIQGDQNRVWYIDKNTGKQDLLTSGYGAGVTNSGYAPGSPQNTPAQAKK